MCDAQNGPEWFASLYGEFIVVKCCGIAKENNKTLCKELNEAKAQCVLQPIVVSPSVRVVVEDKAVALFAR